MADELQADVPEGVPYQSLYRRYRPQRFEDVRGQDHVTRALRNAVRDERVAHAYLFSGPRGTGKTSTARILAMALNCAAPVDGEPDGTCASCVGIRQGSSLDVHELDAASNRKLDEMRDLLSRVSLGTAGRWKVYIIDEVHQLTSDAASALLKTLEEPPANVVFVLATTDPQKVLPTIRSRTQHFEFRLIGAEVLTGLLRDVNTRAGLGLPPEAIDLVARRGHGSARDALSVLDQVAAAGSVEEETGTVTTIVDALAGRDAAAVLVAVAEAVGSGRDPRRLAVDLLEHLRNGFLATQSRSLVMLPDDAVAEVEAQARRIGLPGVVRALEVVGQAAVDMRDSVDPRITLEAALVRIAAPALDGGPDGLAGRVEELERRLAALGAPVAATSGGPPGPPAPPVLPAAPGSLVAAPAPPVPPPASVRPAPPQPDRTTGPGTPEALAAPPSPPTPAGSVRVPGAGSPPGRPGEATRAVPPPPPLPGRRPASPPVTGPRRGGPPGGGVAPVPPVPGAGGSGGAPPADGPSPAAPPRPVPGLPPRPVPGLPPRPATTTAATQPPTPVALPSRDELTKAWGDTVLATLPGLLRAYFSAGRWSAVADGAAIYALADRGLLQRAVPLRAQLEGILAEHFGRPVPVRLVLDEEAPPVVVDDETPGPDEEDTIDLNELEDAGPGLVSPEQRLLEAFPGAEEVTP